MEKILIKDMQYKDRPRERLSNAGPEALSDAEILAIILRTGNNNSSALTLANILLKKYENLSNVCGQSQSILQKTNGIGAAKSASISAVFEIAKRIDFQKSKISDRITKPKDIFLHIKKRTIGKKQEYLFLISLNTKRDVIKTDLVSIGTVNSSLFPLREMIQKALENNAVFIAVVHNHPSQDPTPSVEDISVTKSLEKACQTVGLHLLDHIVVTDKEYYSIKSTNL